MTAPVANIVKALEIPAQPWIVWTLDATVLEYLQDLATAGDPAQSDFTETALQKALWAVQVEPSGTAEGTAFVVSAEAYKTLKAHDYS